MPDSPHPERGPAASEGSGTPHEPAEIVVWCRHLVAVDLDTVDALARLALAAGRLGTRIRLMGVSPALRELLDLAGLELSGLGRDEPPAPGTQLGEVPLAEDER